MMKFLVNKGFVSILLLCCDCLYHSEGLHTNLVSSQTPFLTMELMPKTTSAELSTENVLFQSYHPSPGAQEAVSSLLQTSVSILSSSVAALNHQTGVSVPHLSRQSILLNPSTLSITDDFVPKSLLHHQYNSVPSSHPPSSVQLTDMAARSSISSDRVTKGFTNNFSNHILPDIASTNAVYFSASMSQVVSILPLLVDSHELTPDQLSPPNTHTVAFQSIFQSPMLTQSMSFLLSNHLSKLTDSLSLFYTFTELAPSSGVVHTMIDLVTLDSSTTHSFDHLLPLITLTSTAEIPENVPSDSIHFSFNATVISSATQQRGNAMVSDSVEDPISSYHLEAKSSSFLVSLVHNLMPSNSDIFSSVRETQTSQDFSLPPIKTGTFQISATSGRQQHLDSYPTGIHSLTGTDFTKPSNSSDFTMSVSLDTTEEQPETTKLSFITVSASSTYSELETFADDAQDLSYSQSSTATVPISLSDQLEWTALVNLLSSGALVPLAVGTVFDDFSPSMTIETSFVHDPSTKLSLVTDEQIQSTSLFFTTPPKVISTQAVVQMSGLSTLSKSLSDLKTATKSVATSESSELMTITSVVPATRPVMQPYTTKFLLKFRGDCSPLLRVSNTLTEFLDSIQSIVSQTLQLHLMAVHVHDVSCGSVNVYVTINNATIRNISERMKELVQSKMLTVLVFSDDGRHLSYEAESVWEVPISATPTSHSSPEQLAKTEVIVIIVASCIIVLLLLLGVAVFGKECYKRKRSQTFDLTETPHVHLKMEDFTLTRIPRPHTMYLEDGVTIQSYAETNGHNIVNRNGGALYTKQVNGTSLSEVKLREKSASRKARPVLCGSGASVASSGSQGDLAFVQSTEQLVGGPNASIQGAVNPLYFCDDDKKPASVTVKPEPQLSANHHM